MDRLITWLVNLLTEEAKPINESEIIPTTDGYTVYVKAKTREEAINESKNIF